MINTTFAHLNKELLEKFSINTDGDLEFDGHLIGTSNIGTGHNHTNKDILDLLSKDQSGNLLFNGELIKNHEHLNMDLLDTIVETNNKISINNKEIMDTNTYDTDADGVIDKAKAIDGIDLAKANQYYGKGLDGEVGFHDVNSIIDIPAIEKDVIPFEHLGVRERVEICDNQTHSLISASIFANKERETSITTERLLEVSYSNNSIKVINASESLESIIPKVMSADENADVKLSGTQINGSGFQYRYATWPIGETRWASITGGEYKYFLVSLKKRKIYLGRVELATFNTASALQSISIEYKNTNGDYIEIAKISPPFRNSTLMTLSARDLPQAEPSNEFRLKYNIPNTHADLMGLQMFTGYGISNFDTKDHILLTKPIDIKNFNIMKSIEISGTDDFRYIFKFDNEEDWRYLKLDGSIGTIYAKIADKNFEDYTEEELAEYENTILMIKKFCKPSRILNLNEVIRGRRLIQFAAVIPKEQGATINHFITLGTETTREQIPANNTVVETIKNHSYLSADENVISNGEIEVLKQSLYDTNVEVEKGHFHTNKIDLDKISSVGGIAYFNDTPIFPREEFKNDIIKELDIQNTIIEDSYLETYLNDTVPASEIIVMKDSKNILLRGMNNEVSNIVLDSHYTKEAAQEVISSSVSTALENYNTKAEVEYMTTSQITPSIKSIKIVYYMGGSYCALGHISLIRDDGSLLKLNNIRESSRAAFESDEIVASVNRIYHQGYNLKSAFNEFHNSCSGNSCYTLVGDDNATININIKDTRKNRIVGIQFTPFPTTYERRGARQVNMTTTDSEGNVYEYSKNTNGYATCQLEVYKPLTEGIQYMDTNVLAAVNKRDIELLKGSVTDIHSHSNKEIIDGFEMINNSLHHDGSLVGGIESLPVVGKSKSSLMELIPAITTDANGYAIRVNSEYSSTWDRYKAFDKETSTYYCSASNVYTNIVFEIDIPVAKVVEKLYIHTNYIGATVNGIKDITIYGRNLSSATWDHITKVTKGAGTLEFAHEFKNNIAYNKFKLVINGYGNTYIYVQHLQLYYDDNPIISDNAKFPVKIANEPVSVARGLTNGERQLILGEDGQVVLSKGDGSFVEVNYPTGESQVTDHGHSNMLTLNKLSYTADGLCVDGHSISEIGIVKNKKGSVLVDLSDKLTRVNSINGTWITRDGYSGEELTTRKQHRNHKHSYTWDDSGGTNGIELIFDKEYILCNLYVRGSGYPFESVKVYIDGEFYAHMSNIGNATYSISLGDRQGKSVKILSTDSRDSALNHMYVTGYEMEGEISHNSNLLIAINDNAYQWWRSQPSLITGTQVCLNPNGPSLIGLKSGTREIIEFGQNKSMEEKISSLENEVAELKSMIKRQYNT